MAQTKSQTVFLTGDEAGLYLQATTCYVWSPMGQTPIIRADPGRGIPCNFVSYSSAIIGAEITSRNCYHFQAFAQIKDLLGDKPLVLDREFSYLELLQALVIEQVNLVIRLKLRPHFFDPGGKPVVLSVKKGEIRILN